MPDDLNMDNATGNITVSVKGKSGKATQTGLRYRIVFTALEHIPSIASLQHDILDESKLWQGRTDW